jgi:outer membrane protein
MVADSPAIVYLPRSVLMSSNGSFPWKGSALAALALAALAPSVYAQARFAVVDLSRAVLESAEGQRANTYIKTLWKRRQDELDLRQRALKLMRDDMVRTQSATDQATQRARAEEYQRQFLTYQQVAFEYQDDLAQREARVTKHIYTNMQSVIQSVSARQNFTAVFERQGVVYSVPTMDLTDQVVRQYNQQYPSSRWPALPTDDLPAADGGAPAAPLAPIDARDGGAPRG